MKVPEGARPISPGEVKFVLALNAFQVFAESVYGLHHDSIQGWGRFAKEVQDLIALRLKEGSSALEASRTRVIFGKGNPSDGGQARHDSTLGETYERCRADGPNER